MSTPAILVADDHPLFRSAVLHALREALPQATVFEAASAAALDQVLAEQPQIELVLLDLAMPGARGFFTLSSVALEPSCRSHRYRNGAPPVI